MGANPRDGKTLFASEFAYKPDYDFIPQDVGYSSYQQFLNAQYRVLSDVLVRAGVPGGIQARRLCVVAEGVVVDASWHLGWHDNGIKDSHGASGVWYDKRPPRLREAGWDDDLKISWDFNHENGHRVAHLPDVYRLDGHFADSEPALLGLPGAWRDYVVHHRSDRGPSLMSGWGKGDLDSYTSWIVSRRVKEDWLDDDLKSVLECSSSFPNKVPDRSIFGFGPDWAGAQVKVYRSTRANDQSLDKVLPKVVFDGSALSSHDFEKGMLAGDIDIGNPFAGLGDPVVLGTECLLFAKVTKGDRVGVAYYDIGDFSLVMAKSPSFKDAVRLVRPPANPISQTPENYDSRIQYTGLMKNTIFAPIIMR
ncbi:hypothetical protein A2627_03925 [Candidatus Woesebacteria bacterium RIFCSPHIGHO2_01_FULL_39_28]|uniref:Uncharacterized protein n=1 Tax=Candidatus Woesebacteria bacterium RIFCSPHIGHO2_01_FULL_39_28 TaxID=1802496 RepID=A0A1F7YFQ3_9BACT|nr:MAG: hypothetical protein A2627_03925 [Candidatus Woesebacteria bacterium RIFCSPHIGHO2_01_FULL_39_28]OGM57239.1 MAG: hypothetical protein A3A50_00485 [Candidatus Woesebacteria bacterium RIFCSPLOWO2_01_FULL_38_20]